MLILIKILFILATLCLSVLAHPKMPAPKKGEANRIDRVWKGNKMTCERTTCGKIIPEEAYNCVNKCVSSDCYNEIYADNPLEDGEIDNTRSRAFTACVRNQIRVEKYKKKERP